MLAVFTWLLLDGSSFYKQQNLNTEHLSCRWSSYSGTFGLGLHPALHLSQTCLPPPSHLPGTSSRHCQLCDNTAISLPFSYTALQPSLSHCPAFFMTNTNLSESALASRHLPRIPFLPSCSSVQPSVYPGSF